MNNENRPQQVPANADGNLRETHDDESALHSDWGSDESIHESLGDGRPRDAIDEHQGDLQDRDDPEGNLLTESGARSPDSLRVSMMLFSRSRYACVRPTYVRVACIAGKAIRRERQRLSSHALGRRRVAFLCPSRGRGSWRLVRLGAATMRERERGQATIYRCLL